MSDFTLFPITMTYFLDRTTYRIAFKIQKRTCHLYLRRIKTYSSIYNKRRRLDTWHLLVGRFHHSELLVHLFMIYKIFELNLHRGMFVQHESLFSVSGCDSSIIVCHLKKST